MGAGTRYNEIADRYMACWTEQDDEQRHKLVEGLWAQDCQYFNRFFVCTGREQMEFAIGRAHEEYFAKGFTFRSQNDAYGHHAGMKFGWVMISDETGEVDTFGQDFIILNEEGKILVDYQFQMKRPSV